MNFGSWLLMHLLDVAGTHHELETPDGDLAGWIGRKRNEPKQNIALDLTGLCSA